MRTDDNNNPTAFTTDLAREAGLGLGTDYSIGTAFEDGGHDYYTAKLLGDPIAITIRLIDKLGFYTAPPRQRWAYIAIPYELWLGLTFDQKRMTIAFMYRMEGGTKMLGLFS